MQTLISQIITNLKQILDQLLNGLLQAIGNSNSGVVGAVDDLLNTLASSLGNVLASVGSVVNNLTNILGVGKV